MSAVALRLGHIGPPAMPVMRSGLRWLCADGHRAAAREIVAFANIALPTADGWFEGERYDLQVALAPRRAGTIRRVRMETSGGYLDRLAVTSWAADAVWAEFVPEEAGDGCGDAPDLLFLAGRRFSESAEDRSGLMTGWHARVRAWWGEETPVTLLAAGACEQDALLRGDHGHFAEWFADLPGPLHLVRMQDEPQAPNARVLLEGLARSEAEREAIRNDAARRLIEAGGAPAPADWLFLGALLTALDASPLTERYDLLSRRGLHRTGAPDWLSLSLAAELPRAFRHKRLGYTVNAHDYRLREAGAAIRRWLRADFEPVARTPQAIAADIRALAERLAGRTRLMLVNLVSTGRGERLSNYRLVDEGTFAALGSMRARRLNLVADELAEAGVVALIDADALAAGLGTEAHFADGVHASGALNAAMREEMRAAISRS